ncbi:Ig-like domain-containing protein, partial [Pantoea sp. RRHST58]|uniref:Ig-like domain-containing protein n=1 Tax=Pantoea sp. RRHST58 TaxID=3425183 RepID=UPI003D9FD8EB
MWRRLVSVWLIVCQLLIPYITYASPVQGSVHKLNARVSKRKPRSPKDAKNGQHFLAADITRSEPLPALLPEPASSADAAIKSVPAAHNVQKENSAYENNTDFRQPLAIGARDIGTILSSKAPSAEAANYASQLAFGLINQKVEHWLKTYGNARVSVGMDKKITGDFLLPLMDRDNSLLFSQVGMRSQQARNTVNAGLGYRQYVGDWMLGTNTFYDYDYTGDNRRIGAGVEAWRDYLKLSLNGYYGLSGWHQSVLPAMKDYDERPANGFDLKAAAYLPSMPSLGMSVKYAQYLGSDISLTENTTTPDTLKHNPAVLTMGINYTPVPLLTLSARRSFGDAEDTRLNLIVNYKFGVPLYRQISPDFVDLSRSLAGSKYDFVDRNYSIAMQYRKQTLLRIGLPAHLQVQAADTITLPLTIFRDKYGVKRVDWWVSPDLLAHGAHYKTLSPEALEVIVPANIFSGESKTPQTYPIQAIATDNEGNQSNTATTYLEVIPSEKVLTALALSPKTGGLPANNEESYTVTARVSDTRHAALSGQPVTFSLDGLLDEKGVPGTELTSSDGKQAPRQLTVVTAQDGTAVVTIRSRIAGKGTITASMNNGNSRSTSVLFNANATTAKITSVTLQGTKTAKVADGRSAFRYLVTVRDANGNPVSGVMVTPAVDSKDVTVHPGAVTDPRGNTTFTLTSTKAAADVTADAKAGSGAAVSADKKVSFTADSGTAKVSALTLITNNAKADGKAADVARVTVVDANGNPVSRATVNLSATAGAVIAASVTTDGHGQADATLTSTKAGAYTVTAKAGSADRGKTATASFTSDSGTAKVTSVTLQGAETTKVADGRSAFHYLVTVRDANGNPVSGIAVTPAADSRDVTVHPGAATDTSGTSTFTLTSTKAAEDVTANAKAGSGAAVSADKKVSFTADNSTAKVTSVTLQGAETTKVADGRSAFRYLVTVKDANGNPVSGIAVTPGADSKDVTVHPGAATDTSGTSTFTLTSTKATADVTANAKAGSGAAVSADKKVSFTADSSTAKVVSVTLQGAETAKVADGRSAFRYLVTVKDANGNPVSGIAITPGADSKDVVAHPGAVTDTSGTSIFTLTSTKAAADVTADAKAGSGAAVSADKKVSFTADSSTAKVVSVTLQGGETAKVADGRSAFRYLVTVKDANGNPVSGIAVTPAADSRDVTVHPGAATD